MRLIVARPESQQRDVIFPRETKRRCNYKLLLTGETGRQTLRNILNLAVTGWQVDTTLSPLPTTLVISLEGWLESGFPLCFASSCEFMILSVVIGFGYNSTCGSGHVLRVRATSNQTVCFQHTCRIASEQVNAEELFAKTTITIFGNLMDPTET